VDENRFCLPRTACLRKRAEFLRAYEKGKRVMAASCVIYILENGLPHSRLGVTVSRKVGKAVTRNRVKRRLREIFRTSSELPSPPCDIVVNARRATPAIPYRWIKKDFLKAVLGWKQEVRKTEQP